MPNTYGNRIKVSTSTTGTGTITLGSAVDGFQTFSSGGITDGNTVAYVIEDGSNFEIGTGTYTASGTTLTRTVSESTNSNNAISLSGDAVVFIAPSASDLPFTDGASFSGAVTFADAVTFDGAIGSRDVVWDRPNNSLIFNDNAKAKFGTGQDLEIFHGSNNSYIDEVGGGSLFIRTNGPNVFIGKYTGSEYMAVFTPDGAVSLRYDNATKFETTSGGINVTGTVTDDGAVHDGDVTFTGDSYSAVWDKSDSALEFADNAKAKFGTSGDLEIYHSGAASIIQDVGNGPLYLKGSTSIDFFGSNNEYMAYMVENGGVGLYFNHSRKFETTSSGVTITGNIVVSGTVDGRDIATDGTKLDGVEASADVTDATNVAAAGAAMLSGATFTGDVTFDGDAGNIVFDKSHDSLSFFQAAALKFVSTSATSQQSRIQWDGTRTHWETFNSTRVDLDGDFRLVGQSYNVEWDKSANALEFADNAKATFGTGNDLQISHGGVFSNIIDSSNALYLQSAAVRFANAGATEIFATMDSTDGVKLNFGGSTKLQTSSSGVTVTGTLAATAVTGDGSGLTGLPAGASSNVGTGNFIGGTNAGVNLASGGQYNTLLGQQAGSAVTTGDYNAALGYQALLKNTTGLHNVAIGNLAGEEYTATESVFIGKYAGKERQSGNKNIGIGTYANAGNSGSLASGVENIGIGRDAAATLTTGTYNIAIGSAAGYDITSGTNNVLLGYAAGYNLDNSSFNVMLGYEAGKAAASASSVQHSVGIGFQSLLNVTTGDYNIALGAYAADDLTTGTSNIAIGERAMSQSAGVTGSNNISIGKYSSRTLTSGGTNAAVGWYSLYNITTGSSNAAFGTEAGYDLTTGSYNTMLGYRSGRDITTGEHNVAIGSDVMQGSAGVTGHSNVGIGRSTLHDVTSGHNNVGLGFSAGKLLTTGDYNIAIGSDALEAATTADGCVAIGHESLSYNTASNNIGVGRSALARQTTGDSNTAVGYSSLYGNSSFLASTALGALAGQSNTGNYNTFIGYNAQGQSASSGSNNTVIGNSAALSSTSVSNEITLGNASVTRFRVPAAGIDSTSAALSGTTPSVDVSARDTFTLTTSGNTTFTFTNPPTSPQVGKFTLILTAGGTHTLTWPSSVDWAGGTAPDAPASGAKNIYTFITIDGGTIYYGFLAGAAMG